MQRLKGGLPLSPGFAEGWPLLISPAVFRELSEEEHPSLEESLELERLEAAMQKTGKQLEILREKAIQNLGEEKAAILEAHGLMLRDPVFSQKIRERIASGESAANAVFHASREVAAVFEALPDPYLRERGADVLDVGRRLYRNLLGEEDAVFLKDTRPRILVTSDLPPSEAVALDPSVIRGILTEQGGVTSHTALVAQSLGIPAISGIKELDNRIPPEAYLCLAAEEGEVLIDPSPRELEAFRKKARLWKEQEARLESLRQVKAVTRDGKTLALWGNVASPEKAGDISRFGGTGIGLFRTEFLFMGCQEPPEEEFQYRKYVQVLEELAPFPVVIRTLDAGGDKDIPFIKRKTGEEANPFLGYRAIRICLEDRELFGTQLRALLRAAPSGNLWLMFPMITGVEEVRAAKEILRSCGEELDRKGIPWAFPEKIGIMVETPAAVAMAEDLAEEVDFFSVGTNDLTQYTLACDRLNSRLSYLYDPCHPGVLRLLHMLGQVAERKGKDLGMCGEMAGDPLALPLLLGLGFTEFSMTPVKIPRVKERLLELSTDQCGELAKEALTLQTAEDVRQCLQAFQERFFGERE
ncbi:MAG TPA: phosphoenolpyruvate--protein phosphotransferase [Synergistaceae bacterium]|nr:phosphoenolpyruvate--protein phosphotransferase [Synergistaceae bacterium]HPQ37514.1 phosphoenolpyruvate--protein phosphotransferase [Synergistaceae bacterium]